MIHAGSQVRDDPEWFILLTATSHYECSDDHDRLYAFRGFLKEDVALSIPVDYKRSNKQVLASTWTTQITLNRDLQFLELCSSDTLPTWTADLGKRFGMLLPISDASGRSASSTALIKPGLLVVVGISWDEICSTPLAIHPRGHSESEEDYMVSVMRMLRCLTDYEYFHKDEKRLDELITMLTFGRLWDYHIVRTNGPPGGAFMFFKNRRALIRHILKHNTTKAGFVDRLVVYSRIQTAGCTRTRN